MTTKSTLTTIALVGVFLTLAIPTSAKEEAQKKVIARSVYYSAPSGYTQLGNTDLFYRQSSSSVDFIGRFNSNYYSSTYSNNGYKLAIKVGDNSAINVDCLYGTTVDGVSCTVSVVPQGELGRVVYTVSNTQDTDIIVSLGTHADVMIGSNDSAPISRRIDTIGNTYGLTMRDGNGAQLCVLFGAGLVGVNSVSDFWFGHYSLNKSAYEMVGNYSSGSNYMKENGSYDSGMGWCWKDRTVPANSSVEFSYLIGVGDVNLEPNSTFEVTPDDPDGWNDLSRPHILTLEGEYESPAGQNGRIEYAVEDSEDWQALTEELESGSSFTGTLVAMFNQELPTHTIRFRTVDAVGNTSLLSPIVYKDVRFANLQGIENKYYNWGDSLIQESLYCDLDPNQYEIAYYRNNINAGVASFNIEGVFPYTIGRKTYNFNIVPLDLPGAVQIDSVDFVYNGLAHTPAWSFTDTRLSETVLGKDFIVRWENNLLPGTASLSVAGLNNFKGELKSEFFIDKAQLSDRLYTITLPDTDITYDGNSHGASVVKDNGIGNVHFYYSSDNSSNTESQPSDVGTYDIHVSIDEGTLYYGKDIEKIGSFTIYQFDEDDWNTLQSVAASLTQRGWQSPWNFEGGITTVSSLYGLTIEEGKIIGINLSSQSLSGTFPTELLGFANLAELDVSNNNFSGDLNSIALMAVQNPVLFSKCRKLDISNNRFNGNIGEFANAFTSLTTLDASSNHISEVYPMISTKVVELNLEGQTIDNVIELDLANMTFKANPMDVYTGPSMQSQYFGGIQNVYSLRVTKHFGRESGYVIKGARGSRDSDTYPSDVDMSACFGTIKESEYQGEEKALFTFEDAGNGYWHIYCINDSVTPVVRLATISSTYTGAVQRLTSSNQHLSEYNLWEIQNVGNGQIKIYANGSSYGWDASRDLGTASPYTRGDIMLYSGGDYFEPILESTNPTSCQIPTILLYDHSAQSYRKPLNLRFVAGQDFNLVMNYSNGQIKFTDVSEQNSYYGNSGDILSVVALASNSDIPDAYLRIKLDFSDGDANFNGIVDILDLQSAINYMFGEYIDKPFNFTAANLWHDDIINVQDAVGIVNLLLNNEQNISAYAQRKARAMLAENNNISDANIMISDGNLYIESSKPIAAFDVTISGEAQVSDELSGLGFVTNTKNYNGVTRIIGYSLSGQTVPSNTVICTSENPEFKVIATKLADRDANEVTCNANITTGIEVIRADKLENSEVYTLDGIRISNRNLKSGKIYIIKSGGKARKIVISQ